MKDRPNDINKPKYLQSLEKTHHFHWYYFPHHIIVKY